MNLKTSDFASHGSDPNAVAISNRTPNWYKGKRYPDLAPPKGLFTSNKDIEFIINVYYESVLIKLNPYKVIYDIGPEAVMLSSYQSGDMTHRGIVSEWIKSITGIGVLEVSKNIVTPEMEKTKKFEQLSLWD